MPSTRDHDADESGSEDPATGAGTNADARAENANVDELVDAMLAATPKEFVTARNHAAARLKQAGDKAGAARVRALRRPPPSVWAINQLAHREPDAIEELLDAGAALVAAEQRALAGDSGNFLADARAERQRVAALARRAEAILAEVGQRASATTARRIAQTLQAVAISDDDTRATLRVGRLTEDLDLPSGFASTSISTSTSTREPGRHDESRASPASHEHVAKDERGRAGSGSARDRSAPDERPAKSNRKGARTKLERAQTIEQKRARERANAESPRDQRQSREPHITVESKRDKERAAVEHKREIERATTESKREVDRATAESKRETERATAEHKRAQNRVAISRERAAQERKRAAQERKRVAAERARERRDAAAARKRRAALERDAKSAEREVIASRRVVDRARAAVEEAERRLRKAKDALAQAELAARAARRAADDLD